MVFSEKIFDEFNLKKQAQELGVSVWQSPSFLFLVMGLIIMVAMIVVYFMSRADVSVEILVISESLLVIVLFTMGNFIIGGIDAIARANKIKTEFVSIASHQLKAPLAEVNWVAEFLINKCREGLSEKQLDLINSIVNSNGKMARLVNDLLDVARIDQGRIALIKDNFNIADTIEKVIEDNKALAQKNNIKVEFSKEENIPAISGDRKRIEVVLDNLISNGIKYSNEKEGVVKVLLQKKKNNIEVCVKDNGIGIPKNQQARVFQKFFRSENASKTETEGTGLGLYIAKNFIVQLGGKIWFESIEGKGSEFYFILPISRHDEFFNIKA